MILRDIGAAGLVSFESWLTIISILYSADSVNFQIFYLQKISNLCGFYGITTSRLHVGI